MMNRQEEDYLTISEIQRFTFCPREWALTHIEQQWAENVYTVDGNIVHEKVHDHFGDQKRYDRLDIRGMKVISHKIGITGICDMVEFYQDPDGISLSARRGKWHPVPVEYKRGKPKKHDADLLQLCAQALCLEEMLVCNIEYGFIYYNEVRRRQQVDFTPDLRQRVTEGFKQMRMLKDRGHTPKVKPKPSCRLCALQHVCMVQLSKTQSVSSYMQRLLEDEVL